MSPRAQALSNPLTAVACSVTRVPMYSGRPVDQHDIAVLPKAIENDRLPVRRHVEGAHDAFVHQTSERPAGLRGQIEQPEILGRPFALHEYQGPAAGKEPAAFPLPS